MGAERQALSQSPGGSLSPAILGISAAPLKRVPPAIVSLMADEPCAQQPVRSSDRASAFNARGDWDERPITVGLMGRAASVHQAFRRAPIAIPPGPKASC